MQLVDAAIRAYLHADILAAWDVEEMRPDAQRVAHAAEQLPKARVILEDGASVAVGGGASSREAVLPHTYRITGRWAYPSPGSEVTVNELQVARWNALVARLTAAYPHYGEWRYSEEIGWEFEDIAAESVYTVTVVFTLLAISRVQTA